MAAVHMLVDHTSVAGIRFEDTPVEGTHRRRSVDLGSSLDAGLGKRREAVVVDCSNCLSC